MEACYLRGVLVKMAPGRSHASYRTEIKKNWRVKERKLFLGSGNGVYS